MKKKKEELALRSHAYQSYLKQNPRMYRIARQMEQLSDGDPADPALCHVFAPSLGAFTQWLLLEALKDGRKRLYFLARDGYFMYRAARVFCETLSLPIECRYLSCSRYSARIPVFHLDPQSALSYICRGGVRVTLETILSRAGLSKKEQSDVFSSLRFCLAPDCPIPYRLLPQIQSQLSRSHLFMQYMDAHSRGAFPDFAGYLRQEGLLDGSADALVDSGWVGSMQKTLDAALQFLGRKSRLEGYYWGLYELPAGADASLYHCFYFDPDHFLRRKVFFNNCLFEAVLTAPHGMTLSYRAADGTYTPVYAPFSQDRKPFLSKTEKYLMQYIRLLAIETKKSGFYRDLLKKDLAVLEKLLKQLMVWPSRQEAEQFGSLPFSDDVFDCAGTQLAPVLSPRQLRQHYAARKLFSMLFCGNSLSCGTAWYEGSVVRSAGRVRRYVISHTVYKYIRYLRKLYDVKKNRQVKKQHD